ncbi:hypothetical protein AT6N2_C0430 [Agrobacterium tumefaciens]|uniref:hypothetical protein n=1 Tax=Agrobacterium tumefaciens TaxID=358 RepID=UPI001BB715A4|nr:hypothetical protein [Agrobacterium tumefaciens]QTK78334.1 hypothetical protein AT6N2_C0430 [Agrobacterium tumefaciens]
MATVTWYGDGTATVAVGSRTVTGTNTGWLTEVAGLTPIKAGDKFGIHVGRPIVIEKIISNTELLLADDWPGPAQTDAPYKVELTSPTIAAVEAMRRLLASLSNGNLESLSEISVGTDDIPIGIGPGVFGVVNKYTLKDGVQFNVAVPNIAGRAAYNGSAAGFRVLVADIGDGRTALYIKNSATSGDWSVPYYITGPVGPAGINQRGNYSAGTAYAIRDIVQYGGSTWIAKVATSGNAPPTLPTTENTQWLLFARSGTAGVVDRGAYSGATAYAANDIVLDNGSTWIALQPTTGNVPPVLPAESNAYWRLLARKGTDGTGTGDVVGPAGAADLRVAVFDGATGKIIKDSGVTVQDLRGVNLCYNPGCQVWQARTSVPAMPHRTPLAVGFLYGKSGTAVAVTGERSTDVPDPSVPYSMKLTVTAGATSLAADTENHIRWAIYGRKLKPYASTNMKVKFWVKSSVVGTYCVTAINETRDTHFVREYAINAANTWEEKELTFPLGSKSGTWNLDDGYGVGFRFCLVSASGMQSTKDAWNAGNKSGTSSQVNWIATVGNTFFLTKLQISPEVTGQFVLPDIEAVMSECDREYIVIKQESGGVNVSFGSSPGTTSVNFDILLQRQMYNPPLISFVGSLNSDVLVQSTNGGASVTVANLQSFQRSKQVAKFSLDGAFSAGAMYNLRLQTATAALVVDGHLP